MTGTATTAIENGKTRLCKTCEARAAREAEESLVSVVSDKMDQETAPSESEGGSQE